MKRVLLCFFGMLLQYTYAQEMALTEFANGFSLPVDISHAGDTRLFITEKAGVIRVLFPDGSKHPVPFLDIKSRVNSSANERGLLGLCFHPDYAENGYFFVNYTNLAGHSTISRFTVTSDPNVADPNSEKIIIVINQPFNNHNAGDLEFGPDGFLYIGMGDGGSGGDPGNRSQNPKNLLGKMLRLDINTSEPYRIPADNPWASNPDTLPEIWAFGLRNPWRFSFDRLTGDLWIGDVGQNQWEEINFVKNGTPAVNYGWRCYEGFVTFNTQGCQSADKYTPPVFVYRNPSVGCSVTGGFVYRGPAASRYQGKYIFTDYCSGRFWSVDPEAAFPDNGVEIGKFLTNQYVTLGEDYLGNLYVAGIGNGRIYRFSDPKCQYLESNNLATVIPVSCADSCDAIIQLQNLPAGTVFQWSHGPDFQNVSGLCPGDYSVLIRDTAGCQKTLEWTIESPLPLTVGLTADGLTLTATANQQVEYQWYKNNDRIEGADGNTLQASGSGTYFVVVINAVGCAAQSDSVQIVDCAYLEAGTTISVTPPACYDSCDAVIRVDHTATGISYLWINGTTGPSIEGLCPGSYAVIISDSLGCEGLLEMVVDTVEELTIDIMVAGQFFEAFANQPVQYQWYRNGEIIPGATGKTFEATSSGEYYVIIINEKGCTVQSMSIMLSNTDNISTQGFAVRYKSPSKDGLDFVLNRDVTAGVRVFDFSGRLIYDETTAFAKDVWHRIPADGLTEGYYFLHLLVSGRPFVYKIFLKR